MEHSLQKSNNNKEFHNFFAQYRDEAKHKFLFFTWVIKYANRINENIGIFLHTLHNTDTMLFCFSTHTNNNFITLDVEMIYQLTLITYRIAILNLSMTDKYTVNTVISRAYEHKTSNVLTASRPLNQVKIMISMVGKVSEFFVNMCFFNTRNISQHKLTISINISGNNLAIIRDRQL